MYTFVVDQTRFTFVGYGFSMGTFDVVSVTFRTVRVKAELVLTTRSADRSHCKKNGEAIEKENNGDLVGNSIILPVTTCSINTDDNSSMYLSVLFKNMD